MSPFIASSDWVKAAPDQVSKWIPGGLFTLGTDGYGRSDGREALRSFFEVNAEWIVLGSLYELARRGQGEFSEVVAALRNFGIDPDKSNPVFS